MPPRRPKPAAQDHGSNGAAKAQIEEKDQPHGKEVKSSNSSRTPKRDAACTRRDASMEPSFDHLLQQLQGVLWQFQEWGQQEGSNTVGTYHSDSSPERCVRVQATQSKAEVEHVGTSHSRPQLSIVDPEDIKPLVAKAEEKSAQEASSDSISKDAPKEQRDRHGVICGDPDDMNASDLRLCEVWEADAEAFEPVQVVTPHGRLNRLSDRTFFGNVKGHEQEAWKTAVMRSKTRSKSGNLTEASHWTSCLILTPFSRTRAIWEVFGVCLLVWDMFFVPFQTFGSAEQPLEHALIDVIGILSLSYWSADVVASFCVGFYRHDGMVEMRPACIARNYVTTWFTYDVLCVSTDYVLHFLEADRNTASMIRMARGLRLLRVLKLQNRLRHAIQRIQSNQIIIVLKIVKSMAIVLVLNHVIACGWHWIGTSYSLSEESWVTSWLKVEGDPDTARSLSYRYCTSLHWAITQLGVGAIEIHPKNSAERLYATCVGIGALVVSSVLVSTVTTSMVQLQELHQEEAKQDHALRQYLRGRSISTRLQGHIWAFLKKARKQDKDRGIMQHDVEAIARLPSHMALALRMEVYVPTLIEHPFFSKQFTEIGTGGSQGKTTRDLIGLLQEVKVNQEEDLFRTGDPAVNMQFVAQGEVLYKSRLDCDSAGTTLGPHDWLAEQALWLKWVHVGRAVAMQVCEMFVLDSKRFQKIMINERSAKLYALLFLQRITSNAEPVTDAMGTKEDIKSWQNEISLLAFNIRYENADVQGRLTRFSRAKISTFSEIAPM